MEEKQLKDVAYRMAEAYRMTKTQGDALEYVKNDYPDIDSGILWVMWIAIDAHVDSDNGK